MSRSLRGACRAPLRQREGDARPQRGLILLMSVLLLFFCCASTTWAAKAKPVRRSASAKKSAAHKSAKDSARGRSRGAAGRSHGRSTRIKGPRVHVDPVSRLNAISTLASTLSHGSSALSFSTALSSFYGALAQHEDQPDDGTVRVLQFGDSHTAADLFTGEARRVLQHEFGNGSVGYTYAGHPFAGYRIFGSQRSQSGGWSTEGTHFADLGDGLLGMGGIGVSTARAGEFITLDAPCSSLELEYLQQPGGGTVHLTDNGAAVSDIATSGETTGPGTYDYNCTGDSTDLDHHFVLTTTGDSPVRLLGLVALQPGVTWESIGINGAEAPLILRWDQSLFTAYLRKATPSLVVLAYGTNEAAAHYDPDHYAIVFGELIDLIHRTTPGASVLVLGPTDRATAARRAWHPFSGTQSILDAQRDVCRTHGCAFWDQRRRMGGLGSMQQWVRAGWAQGDHTHLTGEGYRSLADALLADLLAGYDMYRKQHGLPSSNSLAKAVQQEKTGTAPPETH